MTEPASSDGAGHLNFDRAEAGSGTAGAARDKCANCGKALGATYHTVNGQPICASCRALLEGAAAPVQAPATLAKAITFGIGASVVGAVIYYAVMRYLNLEIGLVAILTGWMVGKAMSKATSGRGGRLLQVSAAILTYISVAMAYVPFVAQQSDERIGVLFAIALPVLAIVGSMPGGLISAAIIGFGMMQAWQLTGAPKLVFEGPFRLATTERAGGGGGVPT